MKCLKNDPLLLHGVQERSRTDTIVQIIVNILSNEQSRSVCQHGSLKWYYVREVRNSLHDHCQLLKKNTNKK